jgi:hypothetical protein
MACRSLHNGQRRRTTPPPLSEHLVQMAEEVVIRVGAVAAAQEPILRVSPSTLHTKSLPEMPNVGS